MACKTGYPRSNIFILHFEVHIKINQHVKVVSLKAFRKNTFSYIIEWQTCSSLTERAENMSAKDSNSSRLFFRLLRRSKTVLHITGEKDQGLNVCFKRSFFQKSKKSRNLSMQIRNIVHKNSCRPSSCTYSSHFLKLSCTVCRLSWHSSNTSLAFSKYSRRRNLHMERNDKKS